MACIWGEADILGFTVYDSPLNTIVSVRVATSLEKCKYKFVRNVLVFDLSLGN